MISKVRNFYKKYERWVPIASFFAGFVFDTFMLRRIDELATILQQALYIIISGALISVELIEETREVHPPSLLRKIWKYREFLLHFLLGTLLNSYTIFYFKSASAITSFIFIILLVALLIFNEFMHFGKSQIKVHVAFWSLCLISYLASLAPILLGFIGIIPFLSAVAASILIFSFYCKLLKPVYSAKPGLLRTHLLVPYASIQALFVFLYFIHAIPPVPLSVSYMGIFHNIEKKNGGYELSYMRPYWKFWEHGDQTFSARAGDPIFCFVQIFSPGRFKEELQVRWLYKDPKHGWLPADAIPMPIVGGREEGYRAITKKNNYQPGSWRVQIETRDAQEIGRIGFTVVADESTDERTFTSIER